MQSISNKSITATLECSSIILFYFGDQKFSILLYMYKFRKYFGSPDLLEKPLQRKIFKKKLEWIALSLLFLIRKLTRRYCTFICNFFQWIQKKHFSITITVFCLFSWTRLWSYYRTSNITAKCIDRYQSSTMVVEFKLLEIWYSI